MLVSTSHKCAGDSDNTTFNEYSQRKRTTKWQKGERLDKMRKGGTCSHFRVALLAFSCIFTVHRSQLAFLQRNYLTPGINNNFADNLAVKRVRLFNQSISAVACELGLPERTLRRSRQTRNTYCHTCGMLVNISPIFLCKNFQVCRSEQRSFRHVV